MNIQIFYNFLLSIKIRFLIIFVKSITNELVQNTVEKYYRGQERAVKQFTLSGVDLDLWSERFKILEK